MSVAGLDFGNLSLLIGQTSKGGVDVILNDSSNRQTATCVSIQGKQRFVGDAAANIARSNVTNTITCMKLLVGRRFDNADAQRELSKAPFTAVKLPSGGIGIQVLYNDSPLVVPVEHVLAMMLVKAKDISTKANNGVSIGDAVLAVPYWFTDAQRRGLLTSCEIANVNCLKVANESTMIALSYGIFKSAKKLFSETQPMHFMFIDIGYTCYTVTIVDFIQENMRVLSTVCDHNIGGRDFDDVIIEFLAESFQKKTGINVRNNVKAILKLQAAAEKAKKTLSPQGVNEAAISVECLADEKDLSCSLSKDEFESRCTKLIARLEEPVRRCLGEAGLRREDLTEVEIVGGSSRVNSVKKALGAILGLDASTVNYGLKTTMNSDEAVARGGALQCAILSSRVKVKPFNIVDKVAYGIVVHYENTASDSASAAVGEDSKEDVSVQGNSCPIYSRGDDLPHKPRRLTFRKKNGDFPLTVSYDDAAAAALSLGPEDRIIAQYTIKVPATLLVAGPQDVRVTFNLDKNGCVVVQSAQLIEEIPVEAESKEEGKESKEGEEKGPAKKKFRKTDLEVITQQFGLTKEQVKQSIELEVSMAFEDRLITETADKRNELESYIYSMRDKIGGSLKSYGTTEEKDRLRALMDSAEEWLYGDGFDSTKQQYTRKIDELRAIGDLMEMRLNEESNRQASIDSLKRQIEMCKSFCSARDAAHEHITDDERERVRNEANSTETWLYDTLSKQSDLARNHNPILTVDSINKKRTALFNFTNPIMIKPKPKPAAPPAAAAPDASQAPPPSPHDHSHDHAGHGDHDHSGCGGGCPMEEGAPAHQDDAHAHDHNHV